MNENIVKSKENRRKIYISLLVTVICLIGLTYALFTIFLKQTENNSLATRTCFSTSLTEETSKITLDKAYPLTHEKGLETTPFTFKLTNNCDKPVKVYVTIDSTYRTSTSSSYLSDSYIRENINLKGETTAPSVILTEQTLKEIDNGNQGYVIKETWLEANEEKEYDLRLWMDESVTVEQGLNKTWKGSVVVSAVAETKLPTWDNPEDGTLLAAIKSNNTVNDTLTIPGKEVNAHTLESVRTFTSGVYSTARSYYVTYGTGWESNGTNFNLTGVTVTPSTYTNSYATLVGKYINSNSINYSGSSTSTVLKNTTNLNKIYYIVSATANEFTYKVLSSTKNVTEKILSSTQDDYGTSYYFRGAVENNYVEYANMCWRIVRVTGDGSIKLVLYNYNGLTENGFNVASKTPCNETGAELSFVSYNQTYNSVYFNRFGADNAHEGLMYGNIGCSDGISLREKACLEAGGTWKNSSSYLEAHANINKSTILINLEEWYDNVLSKQSGFNDDQLADTIWCNDKKTENTISLGYGENTTSYAPAIRISAGEPSLICPNDNLGGNLSKFTVSDTINGNGDLSKKIGLLTIDEITFAGGAARRPNSSYYLYQNALKDWWLLSPHSYAYGVARTWLIESDGLYDFGTHDELDQAYIRPSISLVSNIKISSGTGTATDPYKIAV
ncbi:MAG: hypothetical protein Q4C44_01040 [bacterium]|nr:hypothetical protein [bacterium]